MADGLAAAGAKVAVLGRNAERGEARVKAIQTKGGTASFFNCDAISRCSLAEAHEQIEAKLGSPTILVNAAGGNAPQVTVTAERAFEQIQLADWQANFDLNLAGGVLLPYYSPLKVAEVFRMLEAMFPGRIDLGIGRAPGGDRRTAYAMTQIGRAHV